MVLLAQNTRWNPTRRGVLLTALALLVGATRPASATVENNPMDQSEDKTGKPNPHAPAALSRFTFLIGTWRFAAKVKSADGEWQRYKGTWLGHFILDGYAISDEYRMTDASGELIVLGMNFRTYDSKKQAWNIKWLDALAGTWTDLTSPEFGGVKFDGGSVSYAFEEPTAAHAYTRATYTNISRTHFTWRGEKSDDGKTWSEFMVVEVDRTEG
jgi:hypothetical protein